ncbi:MAG TPA: nucleotidyl transferase AbiEii/AbiGii toxin family protein, partial [Chloroflexota bacterium]
QVLQRLTNEAVRRGLEIQQVQQRLAFERLLARLPSDGSWVLKGGFALQVRYGLIVRPTRDIDLLASMVPEESVEHLRRAAAKPGEDRFIFVLQAVARLPEDAAGTLRVFVRSRLSDRDFVRFHLDLVSGEALVEPPDRIRGMDLLGFAGIAPLDFPVFPLTQHLAQKLHAYTQPRLRENSRVKDLVLLPTLAPIAADGLQAALDLTFGHTGEHPLPARLPGPPPAWAAPFATLSAETPGAPTADLDAGYAVAARFWDPVLAGDVSGCYWRPERQGWVREPES